MIEPASFISQLQSIEEQLRNTIIALLAELQSLSVTEQLVLIRDLNVMELMETHGLTGTVGKLKGAFATQISKLQKGFIAKGYEVAPDIAHLQILNEASMDSFIASFEKFGASFRQTVIMGIVARTPISLLKKQLTAIPGGTLGGREAEFLLSETFARYDRAVTAEMFADQPEILFIYTGPQDAKNRPGCAVVLSTQGNGFTREEIDAGDAHPEVDFISQGGFNCRHDWDVSEKQE